MNPETLEKDFLQKSKIICTTLAVGGGGKMIKSVVDMIDYLIIDEACQCVEPTCLLPFNLNPRNVILVGDQKQLPATTFSDNAEITNFSRSLF
jgi:superfamily I DNA and/or RNA helicase